MSVEAPAPQPAKPLTFFMGEAPLAEIEQERQNKEFDQLQDLIKVVAAFRFDYGAALGLVHDEAGPRPSSVLMGWLIKCADIEYRLKHDIDVPLEEICDAIKALRQYRMKL